VFTKGLNAARESSDPRTGNMTTDDFPSTSQLPSPSLHIVAEGRCHSGNSEESAGTLTTKRMRNGAWRRTWAPYIFRL